MNIIEDIRNILSPAEWHNKDIGFAVKRYLAVNPDSPKNPRKVDKRSQMWVPFVKDLKENGPITFSI